MKSEIDIQKFMEQTLEGKIEGWIWIKILDKMYDEGDSH